MSATFSEIDIQLKSQSDWQRMERGDGGADGDGFEEDEKTWKPEEWID